MPSSTSSSEPPYERPLPELRLGTAGLTALLVFLAGIAAWELYWRDFGVEPSIQNTDGLWAMQRRRIDAGEGNRTVLIGDSRTLFDIDLDTWERVTGERPIQLALEGTSAIVTLEDLADDANFTGRLIIGVAPGLFFSGFAYRKGAIDYYRKETPAQRISQWLSMHLIEPYFAFFDDDFALVTVLKRQPWPARDGVPARLAVRKLSDTDADRNTRMWSKVETDPEYQALAKRIWAQDTDAPDVKKRAELDKSIEKQLARATAAVAKLRARGVAMIFLRPPSAGDYLVWDNRDFPRAKTWDVLLARTGVPGIHFEDYPDMQGLDLPEWSHLSAAERPRYTLAVLRAIEQLPK